MEDWTRRLAVALLAGFATLVVSVPVCCAGWRLVSLHHAGTHGDTGPTALLGGMAAGAVLALLTTVVVFRWTGRRGRG